MKLAWIEDNRVRDVAPGNPTELYHPDVAAHYDTQVPDDVRPGATLEDGQWVNPPEPAPVTPPPAPLSPLAFLRRFNAVERVTIRGSADPYVADFQHLLDLASEIRLDDPDTVEGIGYLVQAGLLTQERADAILAP